MTVYVDAARHPFRRMVMCHMIADSIDELMQMADEIGLDRKWFQPSSHPHFDICKANRAKAIKAGARPVTNRELVQAMRNYRKTWFNSQSERDALRAATCATEQSGKKI